MLERVRTASRISLPPAARAMAYDWSTISGLRPGSGARVAKIADLVVDKPFSLSTVLRWLEDGVTKADVEQPAYDGLEEHQRRHIERVVAESGGNLGRASRRLAISRNRLKRTLGSPVVRREDETE